MLRQFYLNHHQKIEKIVKEKPTAKAEKPVVQAEKPVKQEKVVKTEKPAILHWKKALLQRYNVDRAQGLYPEPDVERHLLLLWLQPLHH